MRDVDVIDRELAVLAAVRGVVRGSGGEPSMWMVDQLLDERLESRRSLSPE